MKKQNLVQYGFSQAALHFWQIFQSEHRIYLADKRRQIPGASSWQKPLMWHSIDLDKAEYKPVNGVIIFDVHKEDIVELFKSIVQTEAVNVLVFNNLDEDIVDLITESIREIEITCLKAFKDIQLLEDLYHIDRIVLKGGNTSYWKELLEDGLLSVNVDVES
jgi:hypothetical protein